MGKHASTASFRYILWGIFFTTLLRKEDFTLHFNLFSTFVCCLCFLSERNCESLPLLPAWNCSLWMQLRFPCHDTCCQTSFRLEIIIKMEHWQGVPFVTVGDSEIFSVIFIIAVGNFLKLCILIKYLFFLQSSEAVVKNHCYFILTSQEMSENQLPSKQKYYCLC